ncbi:MAG: hypothetical protein RLZZ78_653 [Armatimonadota bacterium]|jgi:hypothetical protein
MRFIQDPEHTPGMGMGRGRGQGMMGGGMGHASDKNHMVDMDTIHALFDNVKSIKRTVRKRPDGFESITESSDQKVASMLQGHVMAMKSRLEKGMLIRRGDPLFRALFENADKITVEVKTTPNGIRVIEMSKDPYVIKLLHLHSEAVSGFVKDGPRGMAKMHPVPPPPKETTPQPKPKTGR